MSALDLFAGPGGWDAAARELGIDPLGIEYDDAACATREAAGLRTLQGDVAALDPAEFAPCELLIASPPCQAYSMAGKRAGENDKRHVIACAHELVAGNDTRQEHRANCEDERSLLVVEPLRYALALRPARIALEQVPPVLELWSLFASLLQTVGYRTWAGVLSAERYGVPQTRKRAILLASLDSPVHPPAPTHQAYVPGEPAEEQHTLEGTLAPWVSMAEALGWNGVNRPAPTVTSGGGATGGVEVFAGRRGREEIAKVRTNNFTAKQRDLDGRRTKKGSVPYERPADDPAPTVDTSAGSWTVDRPAPTIVTTRRSDEGLIVGRQLPEGEGRNVGGHDWKDGPPTHMAKKEDRPERVAQGAGNRPRPVEAPAAMLDTRTDLASWVGDRPATTVAGDPRVAQPGHKKDEANPESPGRMQDAVRVTLEEAAVLQGFPPDYPFQGTRTKRFEQVGNAVPPPLAYAVLEALVGDQREEKAA